MSGRAFLIGVSVLVLGGVVARAATDPAAKCAATKLKAAGKKAAGKLGCHAKAATKDVAVDQACLDKATAKFGATFDKVDLNGGCATTGDKQRIEDVVDALVADAVAALSDGGVSRTVESRKCAATKRKATGKKTAGKLKCHAKAVTKGIDVDPLCLGKEESKFSAAFEKAEAKGGCFTLNDAATLECKVDAMVGVVAGELAPALVSLAGQVQPIFSASCALGGCHSGGFPAGGLNLAPGQTYGSTVGVASGGCPSFKRVDPGAADKSYLMFKLHGCGPCFVGVRMPNGGPPLPSADVVMVGAWIAQGAPNN